MNANASAASSVHPPRVQDDPEDGRRVIHPCLCRVSSSPCFEIENPIALNGTGFSIITISLITIIRPIPLLLVILSTNYEPRPQSRQFFKHLVPFLAYGWLAFVGIILISAGVIMSMSSRIRKRCVLMMGPWWLLILYFDWMFWLSLSGYFHYVSIHEGYPFGRIRNPTLFFSFVYLDLTFFMIIHYIFATTVVVCQLSMIEKHY